MIRQLLTTAVVLAAALKVQQYPPASRPFLVHIVDAQWTMHPTAGPNTLSNCVIVMSDAHVRLELRRQEFLGFGNATVNTFETDLNNKQIQILQRVLNAEAMKELSPAIEPATPIPSDETRWFVADVSRGTTVQHVGYFAWKGKEPTNASGAKRAWQESEEALRPLVEWFSTLKTSNFSNWRRVSNSKASLCDITPGGATFSR